MYEIGTNIAWVNRRISTARLTIGEVRYQPGGRCGPRIQPCYELVSSDNYNYPQRQL